MLVPECVCDGEGLRTGMMNEGRNRMGRDERDERDERDDISGGMKKKGGRWLISIALAPEIGSGADNIGMGRDEHDAACGLVSATSGMGWPSTPFWRGTCKPSHTNADIMPRHRQLRRASIESPFHE